MSQASIPRLREINYPGFDTAVSTVNRRPPGNADVLEAQLFISQFPAKHISKWDFHIGHKRRSTVSLDVTSQGPRVSFHWHSELCVLVRCSASPVYWHVPLILALGR